MAELIAKPCCARCGETRFTYTDNKETKHIVMVFAVDAEKPLDDRSILRYSTEMGTRIILTLQEERKRREGEKPVSLILSR